MYVDFEIRKGFEVPVSNEEVIRNVNATATVNHWKLSLPAGNAPFNVARRSLWSEKETSSCRCDKSVEIVSVHIFTAYPTYEYYGSSIYVLRDSLPYTVGRDWSQGYLLLRTSVMETSTVPHDEYSGPSTYVRGYHRLPQEDSPFSNRHKVPREPYPGVVQSPPPYCDPGPQSSPYAPAPQSFNAQQSSNVSNT